MPMGNTERSLGRVLTPKPPLRHLCFHLKSSQHQIRSPLKSLQLLILLSQSQVLAGAHDLPPSFTPQAAPSLFLPPSLPGPIPPVSLAFCRHHAPASLTLLFPLPGTHVVPSPPSSLCSSILPILLLFSPHPLLCKISSFLFVLCLSSLRRWHAPQGQLLH